jgi:hypothetical protein
MKVDYSKAKIYKIVDNTNDNIYIGSTCQPLRKRLSQHKSKMDCSSREIIKNGNYDIILIEDYPCMRKEQLHARERYHIENNQCVNKEIPGRTEEEKKEYNKEWREKNKEYNKEYYKEWREKNKEKIKEYNKEYSKEWREKNKEYKKEYDKEWREKNKEYKKEYNQNNKEKIKENNEKYKQKNRERIRLLERIRRAYKRDCDYLCNIDISIFQ